MITTLEANEIFVFGSNLMGHHYGGAANMAYTRFGAEWGCGEGLTGQSYAIPTMHGGAKDIKPYVDDFIDYASDHPEMLFYVTKIGCGIAGLNVNDIAPLFVRAMPISNVILPKEFVAVIEALLGHEHHGGRNLSPQASTLKVEVKDLYKDKIRGSLMAGAAGDALGYAVEFSSHSAIRARYGVSGITKFALDASGKALISDDTQMTLFTANGLLNVDRLGAVPLRAITYAYIDWYYTQVATKEDRRSTCWLSDISGLYALRAPGNTCLSALRAISMGYPAENNSKGCGGIMRVAPIALYGAVSGRMTIDEVANIAGGAAYITHHHPLGYLSAALFATFLYKVVPLTPAEVKATSRALLLECLDVIDRGYENALKREREYLRELTIRVLGLVDLQTGDAKAIGALGEGWVGEEAWAIALYSALRHIDSVEQAIITAVNHDGDSDSTGSICGNIMGAIYGYDHIKERNIFCPKGCSLEDCLELSKVILTMADDLYNGPYDSSR